jgi:hypothetical protein
MCYHQRKAYMAAFQLTAGDRQGQMGIWEEPRSCSTSEVLLRWPHLPEILHGRGSWGHPPQVKLKSRPLTSDVLVRCKTQQNKSRNIYACMICTLCDSRYTIIKKRKEKKTIRTNVILNILFMILTYFGISMSILWLSFFNIL